ncbi:MAG: hypothetical protein JW820_15570 [Spirochaetales bacterium]|nr:hypothetical protein [Spirochaetales bacterium]
MPINANEDTLLVELPFSMRARCAFDSIGLHSLGDLLRSSPEQFLAVRNVGLTTTAELRTTVARCGYELWLGWNDDRS